MSRPTPRTRAATVLGIAAALTAALIAVGRLLVATAPAFDVDAVAWMAAHRTDQLDRISATVTDLVSTQMVIGLGLLAAVVGAAVIRAWWPAALMVMALVGELGLFLLAAMVVGRARPPVPPVGGVLPPTSSFPSGHTAATVCLYGGIAAIVLITTSGWWHKLVLAAVVLLVVAVAVSRVYRGAHHPTDVLAGAVLGTVWLLTVVWALRPVPVTATAPGRCLGGERQS
jgi:undecaprenyl-diphosphatase